jgi:sirohydrochlorin cobaltochelatase
MDAVDPSLVSQIEHYAVETEGIDDVKRLRMRWVGHQLFAEITLTANEQLTLVETDQLIERIQARLQQALPALQEITVRIEPRYKYEIEAVDEKFAALNILPQRYQNNTPSAAPMGAAALKLDTEGNAAWDEIWTDFCDLALAGGPSHRGTLLEPVNPDEIAANPDGYERVLAELERGIRMVTGRPVVRSISPGWIGMECDSETMALWLLRAIIVENVSVRREGNVLFFPAGPSFRLDKEIKNVITVIAKTTHYWNEHVTTLAKEAAQ